MAREETDWRITGQERYLRGAELTWSHYRVRGGTWEHDHCEFCWATFMDPDLSEVDRQHVAEHPDVLTEGYTTTASHEQGAAYRWICRKCFDDFFERFQWRVVSPPDDL